MAPSSPLKSGNFSAEVLGNESGEGRVRMGAAHVDEDIPALRLVDSFYFVGDGSGLSEVLGSVRGGVIRRLSQRGGNRQNGEKSK